MPNGMEKNNIIYKIIIGFPEPKQLQEILNLYNSIFPDADSKFFKNRLKENPESFLAIAYHKNKSVGFKLGYPYSYNTFYSWIGGVLTEYRNQKIATKLLNFMEDYALSSGFTKLRTKSMNRFKPMIIHNLKNGFDIVNLYTNSKGQTKLVFEKML